MAVIFPYATSASAAAEDVRQLEGDLAPDPGSLATVIRDDRGDYWVTTNYAGDPREPRAAFWFLLFNALIFTPASGTVQGLTHRALARRLVEAGIDRSFQRAIREKMTPDTSALFLLLHDPPPDDALGVLHRFAGTVHTTVPSPRAQALLAGALYAVQPDGDRPAAASPQPPGP
jgi:uncharacterized membrane protein